MSLYVKRGERVHKKPSFWCWHHFFSGMIFLIPVFWMLFQGRFLLSDIGLALGLWLVLDDYFQHRIQLKQWRLYHAYDKYTLWNWLPNKCLFGKEYI